LERDGVFGRTCRGIAGPTRDADGNQDVLCSGGCSGAKSAAAIDELAPATTAQNWRAAMYMLAVSRAGSRAHFIVTISDDDAAAIEAAFHQDGELSAAA